MYAVQFQRIKQLFIGVIDKQRFVAATCISHPNLDEFMGGGDRAFDLTVMQ